MRYVAAERAAKRPAIVFVSPAEHRRVVFASSLGTVFEWYDFYLYATLAPFFASLFFPPGNDTAALLSALATYAAGFLIRPFGAIFFGRIGDQMGRKYAFLITIVLMGTSTFAVGLLPTYEHIGWLAPLMLVLLRLAQGFALGGEYGGAATYVAEHTPVSQRGLATSWIQTTATVGFLLSLMIIVLCRSFIPEDQFKSWGWRIPFLISIVLLVFSAYIRLKLNESPLYQHMKEAGEISRAPIWESFFRLPNGWYILLALLGATAGQGVVWYTGQFYALFFLQITLKIDYDAAYLIMMIALLISTPFFVIFGWLSDKIGRKPIILAGCLLAALTYLPIFTALTKAANPDLANFQRNVKVTLTTDASTCQFHLFVGPWSEFSDCDRAKDYLTKLGLSFETLDRPGAPGSIKIGNLTELPIDRWDARNRKDNVLMALTIQGYPLSADLAKMNMPVVVLLLVLMMIYVCMVYGPMAAFLVDLFPTRIRYTSLSFPYHIGNGWFGGLLPLVATAMVAASGNIYYGLWYPIGIALMTFVVGLIFLRERIGRPPR
ncbi:MULTISPECIES: MFS transporter [Rhodomicrobium]|uniref:MFS transporter n=1 Tax=Rhodomicrobium TaxID=1068 RepID=UPI000B4AA5A1|nr:MULTISPECIES: MFS transporter [Rhodomicrobium]